MREVFSNASISFDDIHLHAPQLHASSSPIQRAQKWPIKSTMYGNQTAGMYCIWTEFYSACQISLEATLIRREGTRITGYIYYMDSAMVSRSLSASLSFCTANTN